MPADAPRMPARYLVVVVVAATAVLLGITGQRLNTRADTPTPKDHASATPASTGGTSAMATTKLSDKDGIAEAHRPALFPDDVLTTVEAVLADQTGPAAAAMRTWWAAHGTTPADAVFLTWVRTQVPAPPSAAKRTAELADLRRLAAARTPDGITAATWLEVHGKKDVWKLYLKDQRELLPTWIGKADKAEEKALLRMAKKAADAVSNKFQVSSPYVLDPSLRPEKKLTHGSTCPCSYPSGHAARAAASAALLGQLDPTRRPEYAWMQSQIAYSRLYMAGHIPSDLAAGTRLGDMIGEYFLVTRGHIPTPN